MGTRKQALSLLTDALQAVQTAAELLQKEGHEDGNHARIMELEAEIIEKEKMWSILKK